MRSPVICIIRRVSRDFFRGGFCRPFSVCSSQSAAMHSHCASCLRHAVPSPRHAVPCSSFAIRFPSWPFTTMPFLRVAAYCISLLCLCASNQLLASPLPFLSMLRISFAVFSPAIPRLAFASLLYAVPLLCRSIHCDDVPLLINSIPSCANPLLFGALLCAAQLFPCAAVQETSAQRKRPLPELRHWPRPR